MIPYIYDFTGTKSLYRGDTFPGIIFKAINPTVDMTGATIVMHVKKTIGHTKVLEWKTADSTIEISTNEVEIKQRDGSYMDIDGGNYVYDVDVTFPDESKQTIVKGEFTIIDDVTRS